MPNKLTFTFPVTIEVDLDEWKQAYWLTTATATVDAKQHVPNLVAHAIAERLAEVDNGARLVEPQPEDTIRGGWSAATRSGI